MASSPSLTPAATHTDGERDNDSGSDAQLQLRRKISQAVDEGHDADIPSSQGFVLSEEEELRRQRSIADRRRNSIASGGSRANRDVEKAQAPGEAALSSSNDDDDSDTSPNVVWWSGPNDPENPYNWPTWRKVLNCGLISAMTFISPLASSIFAPGVPQVIAEFHSTSLEIAAFVVSVYVLGFAAGPMLFAPLSEIYGRVILYHIANVGFVAFQIGCALAPTLNALIVFRFFAGVFGSVSITNGGGTIADMIVQEKRGGAMAVFSIGPLLGPIIGPVAGGFLSDAEGWRWSFWLLTIVGGFLGILMTFSLKESYAPVILERKAAKLRKDTGNDLLRSKLDAGLSPRDYFKRGIIRPFKMLFLSPIVAITSLYMAVTYGYLYLMFTTMTEVFQEYYGFTTSTVGLAFLGLGVGSMIGIILFSGTSDRYIQRKAAQADAEAQATGGTKAGMKPEYRLPLLPLGAVFIPAGLFIYGWTADFRTHWIAPIIGTAIVGIGNLIVFMSIQMYLVDTFTIYAASAIACNTVVRSLAGAVLPLAGLPMYSKLGIGWGNSLLGFIAVALFPVSIFVLKYGEALRNRFVIKNL
ncbi:bicyclomycin resistance protein [Annulohypoxylon maeteangense]|uniref:bicyclomycin resistance protein n=1 Tax=Annulohypoxylon maeteangense TaxID=1927788 RepID=UPI002008409A|nr:bicyclomycin resistance protein [Annulohypoxylon maeteangense]KAI0882357.1 bicyclomycin resistance protein [Annulohypoxylon maeteangense]